MDWLPYLAVVNAVVVLLTAIVKLYWILRHANDRNRPEDYERDDEDL